MANPWLISVSGLMGTGKTTLARGLSSSIGWSLLPEPGAVDEIVSDLLSDPARYAFEAQTRFFTSKALQMMAALTREPYGIVLDRSLEEDAEIFGKYFLSRGDISERAFATYKQITDHFFTQLPAPDVFIYCSAPLEIVRARIQKRGRPFEKQYPLGHLESLETAYVRWWAEPREQSIKIGLDTSQVDTRDSSVLRSLIVELTSLLDRITLSPQISLFDDLTPTFASPELFKVVSIPSTGTSVERPPLPRTSRLQSALAYPSAYVAAPFTEYATSDPRTRGASEPSLIQAADPHGVIPDGPYKSFLISLAAELKRQGLATFLPHRDLNDWGRRRVSPETVADRCAEMVARTDVFIGLVGTSPGAHYELGLASGLRKPIVLLQLPGLDDSYISRGISSQPRNIIRIKLASLDAIRSVMRSSDLIAFLNRYVPLRTTP